MLIRQIRSFGSLGREDGVHAEYPRKPDVPFKTPTYFIGGSNSSLTRQGGLFMRVFRSFIQGPQKAIRFLGTHFVRDTDKKIKGSGNLSILVFSNRSKGLDFSGYLENPGFSVSDCGGQINLCSTTICLNTAALL